ncbi:hypothetical protein RM844_14710 [Streptomyces sp. DSM 44915]|uniref:Uncharacterized protein n=1 Tax=Streptomyces chisholmiae TaxID=3075540 RepID=A0ABU2JRD0_9ACTN|nr:hypothetical protein [Streptomyces sp. DSM 44915]MDT0267539.1 hypothetical protein [Streptomyces sp. DSM 44915]
MAEPERSTAGGEAAPRAWAADTVGLAEEFLDRAGYCPVPTQLLDVVSGQELDEVTEQLVTIEGLLPENDPAREEVVPVLGVLLGLRYGILSGSPGQTYRAFHPSPGRRDARPHDRAAALRHLRWVDRYGPIDDPLAISARFSLVRLLAPKWLVRSQSSGLAHIVREAARQHTLDRDVVEAARVQGRLVPTDLPPSTQLRLDFTWRVLSLATTLAAQHDSLAETGL